MSFVLHIFPGLADHSIPSLDPGCNVVIFYLYLVLGPTKFSLAECTPDLSPSGQLPFLSHNNQIITTTNGIIKYIQGLETNHIDATLTASEWAQQVGWTAHAELNIGDLVACNFYALPKNWAGITQPLLASVFSFPKRYYVPERIRYSYKPRLETAGLWNVSTGTEDEETKKPFNEPKKLREILEKEELERKEKQSSTFKRAKVLERAELTLSNYERLLGDNQFFYHFNRTTTLDLVVAAHAILLTEPKFSDPIIQQLMESKFPTLVSHARRVRAMFDLSQIQTTSSLLRKPKTADEKNPFNQIWWTFPAATTVAYVMYRHVRTAK